MNYRAGEWIEVRNKEEILRTLDKTGQFEGLPFMPQMFEFCGRRLQVGKRAHKTCDTVNDYKGRRMENAVHLEGIRCNGLAYGGCQAGCLIFWKEAWIKRVAEPVSSSSSPNGQSGEAAASVSGCREEDVWAGTRSPDSNDASDPVYLCQATQVPAATQPLEWWDLRQYLEDLTSGNVGPRRMACGFVYMGYRTLINAGIGLGRPLRWLYDASIGLRRGFPYPRKSGNIRVGAKTPDAKLDLKPGDLVRVKSYEEILATLDADNKNRGLYFDAEMVPYCGRIFRVLKRVERIVNEKTGRITKFRNPCIILEGVVCEARYSECRLFCPRAIYSYWREIWLERIPENSLAETSGSS
jgi:hypothetical protein